MTENIKIKRCTCDICKLSYEIGEDDLSPLTELILPVDYCDEYGSHEGIVDERVEVCECCLEAIHSLLSTQYTMRLIKYGGLKIDKKGGEG